MKDRRPMFFSAYSFELLAAANTLLDGRAILAPPCPHSLRRGEHPRPPLIQQFVQHTGRRGIAEWRKSQLSAIQMLQIFDTQYRHAARQALNQTSYGRTMQYDANADTKETADDADESGYTYQRRPHTAVIIRILMMMTMIMRI